MNRSFHLEEGIIMSQLQALREMTVVVADTGDIDAIKTYQPQDATTNPSLILSASSLPQYAQLIDEAVSYAKSKSQDKAQQLIDAEDKLAVNIGLEILKIVIISKICVSKTIILITTHIPLIHF